MTEIVSFQGLAETRKWIADHSDQEMQNGLRRAARAGISEFRKDLHSEAISRFGQGGAEHVPYSFRKTKTKTSTHGGSGHEIESSVRPSSPLFNILEPGAKAHTIAPGRSVTQRPGRKGGKPRKAALGGPAGGSVWTAAGRKRPAAFFSRSPVRHPGLTGRNLLRAAFESGLVRAEDQIANAIFGHSVGSPIGGGG